MLSEEGAPCGAPFVFVAKERWLRRRTKLCDEDWVQQIFSGGAGRMKKKARAKAKATKEGSSKRTTGTAAKKSSGKLKDVNLADVRRDIKNIVGEAAGEIASAVVVEALKGQLATAKYLFEATGIYPVLEGGDTVDNPDDDTFVQRVVRRLGLPEGPLPKSDDDDGPESFVIPAVSVPAEPAKVESSE
jgi:hypothetical protein